VTDSQLLQQQTLVNGAFSSQAIEKQQQTANKLNISLTEAVGALLFVLCIVDSTLFSLTYKGKRLHCS
jgi:hypothetical protein